MYDSSHLRSLNECNIRPRRTSYSSMSTWFFMDKKNIDTNRNEYLDFDDDYFARKSIPSPRKVCEAPVIKDFLMKNWSNEKNEANSLVDKDLDLLNKGKRKGRSGSGGSWMNITQANQDDGKQLLFINDRIVTSQDPPSVSYSKSMSSTEKPRLTYSGRKITKAYLEKLERDRRGIQTKHGIDNGHWKIIR